jgi:erythromycin esterase
MHHGFREAAARIREAAAPLNVADDLPDPAPIIKLLGSANVIGLGEPTHGDAESLRLKHALVRAIARANRRTLVAWERGPGNMRHVASFLAADQELPHESRRWIYPWVYREVDDLLRWARDANRDRPGTVSLCGVDMDGPPPPSALDALAAALGGTEAGPIERIRRDVVESGSLPEDVHWYETTLAALAGLPAAGLAPSDRLLLDAAVQWTRYRLLTVTEREGTAATAYRDGCMAENLVAQRRIHEPDVVIYWAHNAHVAVNPSMAGWHLHRSQELDYVSVGVAFGGGSFDAGTARDGGGFDPELRVFDAEVPPGDTLEALLGMVGLPSFVVDLRRFRGTTHPFAERLMLREVGLDGGEPQFHTRPPIAEMYDVLVWFGTVTPAAILRKAGDFW